MNHVPLDASACKAELDSVLGSRRFARAPALSKLLAYVCTKHLEGADGSVNEWTIAVDALGRRPSFDPEKDSIVRVEFHLLRKRLAQFYLDEGASHPTRIVFCDSGYIPRFVADANWKAAGAVVNGTARPAEPGALPDAEPASPPRRDIRRRPAGGGLRFRPD